MSTKIYDGLRITTGTQDIFAVRDAIADESEDMAQKETHRLGSNRTDLNVGDLWLLSWGPDALALVVITRVFDDYVLGYPVTMPNYPSFSPAVVQNDNKLEVPLTIWTLAETGLGKHLFSINLGPLLSERTVDLLRRYAEDGHESPLPIAEGDCRDGSNSEFLHELLAFMQELSFHEPPINNENN